MQNLTGSALEERPVGPAVPSDAPPFLNRAEWQLARRIAASGGFSKSEFLKKFLLYVCELALLGRTEEITEQRIGIHIFGRPAGYDPGEDNIVRSYARMLRKRLESYFDGEGAEEPLRLTVPRGGYIPVFVAMPDVRKPVAPSFSVPPERAPAAEHAPHAGNEAQVRRPPFHWTSATTGLLAGMVLTVLVWAGLHTLGAHRHPSAAHALWEQMFEVGRNTLIVPADSGLGILENLTHSQTSMDAYANGSYFSQMHLPAGLDAGNFNDLSRQHYTSVVDLGISSALTRLPEFTADRTQIRYARAVTAEDLRGSNIILLGSVHTNPWVSLFEQRLNFRLQYTPEVDRSFIVNQHPLAAEQKVYRNGEAGEMNHTYGTVAYLPDAGGAGHVLIVQGLNMAATQAAADILFNSRQIQPVLAQAAHDGQLRPFELLVETTSIGASAPEARIVAVRVYPQS